MHPASITPILTRDCHRAAPTHLLSDTTTLFHRYPIFKKSFLRCVGCASMKARVMAIATLLIFLAITIPSGAGDQDQVSLRLLLLVGKKRQLQSSRACPNDILQPVRKKSACILLLSPADDYHLTSQCFKNLQKKVKEIPGWDAKRSKATAAEIARFKVAKKGTRYWTFLIYKSGDERVCDCGLSEEIPAALPKAIKSMKPVEKQPEAKGIRNKRENDLNQPLLQSFRKVGVKEYCACGKRKRDTDSGASSSATPVNATVGSSTSSKKESSTSAKKQKVSLDKKKFKCDNICSAAFKHCHEYLWAQKEKDLGYGNIVEILTL